MNRSSQPKPQPLGLPVWDAFDQEYTQAPAAIWFLGDVHGEIAHIVQALECREPNAPPVRWLVFLGDVELDDLPFRDWLLPIRRVAPAVKIAFIHGNHDADSHGHWQRLHDAGDAVALEGRVVDLDGIRVAGLGGHFQAKVWAPPQEPLFKSRKAALNRGAFQYRGGQQPSSRLHAAIYPETVKRMAKLRADLLVTHEAPSCHPHGWEVIDELARRLRVVRSFLGHHHDDLIDRYAEHRSGLGFDARGVNLCGIKDGLGRPVESVRKRQ